MSTDGNLNPDPWIPNPAPPYWPAVQVSVYRITPTGEPPESGPPSVNLYLLPNVEVVAVQTQEGPDPGTAVLRYRFDGMDDLAPQSLEQALSTAYNSQQLPHLVDVGDWLGVFVFDPVNNAGQWIFSGFPLEWEGHLDGNVEAATMNCTGAAKRLWDTPFAGALMRNSDNPQTGGNDVPTDLIPQFNPRGRANASPSTGDSGSSPYTYPVFMDPDVTGTDTAMNPYPETWDIEGAVAHLLFTGNASQYWVYNPTRTQLQSLLVSREPISGTPFDPTNPATYTSNPIAAPDDPLSGKALPILVHDMIKDSGFGMEFYCGTGSNGPICSLNLFLKQAGPVKSIYLASRLSPLDAGANNVASCVLARDLSGVINQWTVDGGLDRWEASFVLYNAFPSQASDSAAGNLPNYKSSSPGFATSVYHDYYRTFILDETGEGHYENASTTQYTTVTSLDAVLGAATGTPPVAQYVARRRAPIGDLLTLDKLGNKLKFQVHVSKAYSGAQGVWDGTATDWQPVKCGISLLKDRIGFRFTDPDPNHLDIGVSTISGAVPEREIKPRRANRQHRNNQFPPHLCDRGGSRADVHRTADRDIADQAGHRTPHRRPRPLPGGEDLCAECLPDWFDAVRYP